MVYEGACHCGALSYRYRTELPVGSWSVRACQCSFCRRHQGISTSDPAGTVEFTVTDPTLLQRYRFGQRTADFLICKRCGCYIGAVLESEVGTYGIVNLTMLVNAPPDLKEPEPMSYDAESERSRIGRRERRWTPALVR